MIALAPADLDALREAAGADAIDEAAAFEYDGTRLATAVSPADAEALARVVAVLAARRIGCAIRGGGTRASYGNLLRDARILLSTRRIEGIVEIDAEEGVAQVLAGTPLASAREAIAAEGWELPLDAPGVQATLGGVLATASVGPRHLGWGRPRDLVLGMDVVLGDGARTRCGGRVVKNVTGYDLMKLHVGGCGAFGVITSAWLRLRPAAERERLVALALPDAEDAILRAVEIARFATARACVLADARLAATVAPSLALSTGWLLLLECAGDEAAVARDVARLAEAGGVDASENGALARARSLQGGTRGASDLCFRLAVLPSRLAAAAGELHRADAALLAHPGSGLVHARIALEAEMDGAGLDRAWRAVRAAAVAGGGHAVLEAAPPWARSLRDVFGDASDEWRLARLVKERFDPHAVLNPGRYVGRL